MLCRGEEGGGAEPGGVGTWCCKVQQQLWHWQVHQLLRAHTPVAISWSALYFPALLTHLASSPPAANHPLPAHLLPMMLLLDTAGVVAIQNVHDTIKGWRISATGVVLEQDAQFRQVKADERLRCLCPGFTFCTVDKNNAARCHCCQAYHGLCRLLVLALAPVAAWFHVLFVSPALSH